MKIWNLLPAHHILLGVRLPDKAGVLRFLAQTYRHIAGIPDPEALYASLSRREETMTTGVGKGIAMPHTMSSDVDEVVILLVRLDGNVDFQSIDGAPVNIVFSLLVPENETTLHLNALAGVSCLCRKPGFLQFLRRATDPQRVSEMIRHLEEGTPLHV